MAIRSSGEQSTPGRKDKNSTGIIGNSNVNAPKTPSEAPIAPGMARVDVATDYLPGTMTEPKKRGLKLFSKETDPAEAMEAYKKGLAEVYPHMEYFWLSHGKRVLDLASKTATEHHYRPGGDRFFQYQIVQQFVGATGQIDVAKIREYFQKNRDAYDKTMLYIDREAQLVLSAQGLDRIVEQTESIVASILDSENIRDNVTDKAKIVKGALEIATVAGVGAGAGAIRFWSQITALVEAGSKYAHIASLIETHAPVLYPFVVNPSLALGPILGGTVVFLTMKGVVDIWSGLNTPEGKHEFLTTCKNAYQAMATDESMCAYTKDMYAFSPTDIRIDRRGNRRFQDRSIASPGWLNSKSFIGECAALRRVYFAKVLGMKDEQSEGEPDLKNGTLAEQSNAIYSRDVYAAFELICKENNRSLANIPEAIRIKYMLEAQKRVIQEWADKRFESVLETRETAAATSKRTIIENTQNQLKADGKLRSLLQKEARENREVAEDLLQGERKPGVTTRSGGLAKEAVVFAIDMAADAAALDQAPITKELSLDALLARHKSEAARLEDIWDEYKQIVTDYCTDKGITSVPQNPDSDSSIDIFIDSLQWYSGDITGKWLQLRDTEIAPHEYNIATKKANLNTERAKTKKDPTLIGQLDAEIASLTAKLVEINERHRSYKETVKTALASVHAAKRNRIKIELQLEQGGGKHEQTTLTLGNYRDDYNFLTGNGADALHQLFANYPANGSRLNDLLLGIEAIGLFTPADSQIYANRMRVMRAVAYAKSKAKYNELIATPAANVLVDHAEVPGTNTLREFLYTRFTQEQIILLGPTELFKRLSQPNPKILTSNPAILAAGAAGTIGAFDALLANEQMRHIVDCVEDEKKRYEATKYGLSSLARQQELIVEEAKNTEANIVKDCDKRVRMLEAAKGVLVDRAKVYKKIPDLLTAESVGRLLTYADVTTASTAGWVEIDNYLEKERGVPVAVLELMRAVFSYDTNVPPDGQTQDEVFADILEAMNKAGGNTATGYETVVKKAILMGILDFANYLTRAADLNTLTLADMLIILRHRISGDGVQHRDGTRLVNRRLVPARPLSSIELKGILRSIIDTVAMPALSGHL